MTAETMDESTEQRTTPNRPEAPSLEAQIGLLVSEIETGSQGWGGTGRLVILVESVGRPITATIAMRGRSDSRDALFALNRKLGVDLDPTT